MEFEVKMKTDKKAGTAVMTITVPNEELAPYKEKAIGIHAREGEVPGFRKGKAPRPRLVAHYGEEAINEFALRLLACEATEQALEKKKAKASGRIHIDFADTEDDKPIEITAAFSIAEAGEEGEPELPWPRVGHMDIEEEERPYGKPPDYLRRR